MAFNLTDDEKELVFDALGVMEAECNLTDAQLAISHNLQRRIRPSLWADLIDGSVTELIPSAGGHHDAQ